MFLFWKEKVFGEVSVSREHLCASVWVRRGLLDFSLTPAAECETVWDRRDAPVNAVSHAHELKAKVGNSQWAGGKPSGDTQAWVSWRWWVVGTPQLSPRAGWLWPALGVCLGQFFVCSTGFSEGICSLAPSRERPSYKQRKAGLERLRSLKWFIFIMTL